MCFLVKAWRDFKETYANAFIQYAIISVIIAVATFVGLKIANVDPVVITKQLITMLGGQEALEEFQRANEHEMFFTLFLNNWGVCFKVLLFALIPFPIYLFIYFVNSAMLGMVAYMMAVNGQSVLQGFVFGILPHGIVELPTIILAVVVAMKLNNAMFKWIFSKFKSPVLKEQGKKAIRQFIFFMTPGMLIAGLIESYITPYLMHLGIK